MLKTNPSHHSPSAPPSYNMTNGSAQPDAVTNPAITGVTNAAGGAFTQIRPLGLERR